MVQNGKFCAGICTLHSALKRVDLPTFGRPTMPIFKWLLARPVFVLGSHGEMNVRTRNARHDK